MKVLILLLFLFSCTTAPDNTLFLSSNQSNIWTDTIFYDNRGGIQYQGTWKDPGYGKKTDKNTAGSEMFYRAWMQGFDLYTYVDGHHGGYWINVDGDRTYVDLTEEPRAIKKTFSVDNLSYGNHNITITPDPDRTFIFVKLVKFVDYSPYDPGLPDTIPPIILSDIIDTTVIRLLDMEYSITRSGRFQIFINDTLDIGEHNEYEKAIEHALRTKALNPNKNVTIKSPIRRIELKLLLN